jgi:isopenicillin-N epimerase
VSLRDELFDRFGIQAQVVPWQEKPKLLVRVSAQIYNTLEQYEYLGMALRTLLTESAD